MSDRHLDPPEYDEAPEWIVNLEAVLEQDSPPEEVAVGVRKILDEWIEKDNARSDFSDPVLEDLPGPDDHLPPDLCPHGVLYPEECLTCKELSEYHRDQQRRKSAEWMK